MTVALGACALILSALLAGLFTRRLAETSRRERASAQEARHALAARDDLLGIVAHDLRGPLGAISLRAAAIARREGDPEAVRSARSIENNCRDMASLIRDLLDAATIEAGRLMVAPECLSIAEIIRSAIETFAPAAASAAVELRDDVTAPDLMVWADRGRVLQVLSNLIGNALKFTPERGAVRVSARQEGAVVVAEVSDTGPGIPGEHLSHIFERYWKSDLRAGRGAGLGLYIAKGIVEALGGRIWVASKPGDGSSFRFELLANRVQSGAGRPAPTTSSGRPSFAGPADLRTISGPGREACPPTSGKR